MSVKAQTTSVVAAVVIGSIFDLAFLVAPVLLNAYMLSLSFFDPCD